MGTLRNIIRQLIKEGIRENELQNLALFNYKTSKGKHYYMLFHPKLVEDIINAAKVFGKSSVSLSYAKALKEIAKSRNVYAMMVAVQSGRRENDSPCLGAWEVVLAAAKKGWGPTMYDIVMGDSPKGIMSDRHDVSKFAKPLYDFYYKNREDIEKIALDNKDYQYTEWGFDDCTWGSGGDYKKDMAAPNPDYPGDSVSSWEDDHEKLWYRDTLNYVYNGWEIKYRQDMENNYFDALEILNKNNILKGPVYETYHWWVKIMRIFFNIQSSNRGI
tara:strand:+ start:281 stop:1099 length:819 start_codon:yes stop_codon:yes gene_type:complete